MDDSFEEQERSIVHLEQMALKLARDAAMQLAVHPD